jgi:hydrogenase maturation protease
MTAVHRRVDRELAPAEVSPAALSAAEVSPAEGCPAALSPAEVPPAEVSPAEGCPAEVSSVGARSPGARPGDVAFAPTIGPDFWDVMGSRGPDTVTVGGVPVRSGSRVRLRPRGRADILDLALDGRTAVVEAIEQDGEGNVFLAVTVADDPGRDLGDARMPGHRFFYAVDDVQPLPSGTDGAGAVRVLVAGIGNVFLGDDGFGCEVARRLSAGPAMPGVDVVEFGIRGMDLAYALLRDYRAAILVDAAPRGYAPGTLTVIEPRPPSAGAIDLRTHGMDPVRVLALARALGGVPARTYVVCCEPEFIPDTGADEEVVMALSAPVRGAVDAAAGMVRSLVAEIVAEPDPGSGPDGKGGEAGEEGTVVGRHPGGRRGTRDAGPAVAGNPAVHEDAPDVAVPDAAGPDAAGPGVLGSAVARPGVAGSGPEGPAAAGQERSGARVPGHPR